MLAWIFLTIGVTVGILWASRVSGGAEDPRLQSMTLFDPKIFVVVLCWFVYSFALYARRSIGWSGRRAALLSAIGFTILLLNFVPLSYFVPQSHNFY